VVLSGMRDEPHFVEVAAPAELCGLPVHPRKQGYEMPSEFSKTESAEARSLYDRVNVIFRALDNP
jgi:hypothetical protein